MRECGNSHARQVQHAWTHNLNCTLVGAVAHDRALTIIFRSEVLDISQLPGSRWRPKNTLKAPQLPGDLM